MDKTKLLIELGRELGIPIPMLYAGYKVTDKNGRILSNQYGPGHSWTRNYYNLLFAAGSDAKGDDSAAFGAGKMSSKQINGTIYSNSGSNMVRSSSNILGSGIINNTTSNAHGILCGTNDTAFNLDQYALQTIIAAGNAAGQLAHVAQAAPAIAYTAGTKTWKTTHTRLFNNNSGALITVKESGLYWYGQFFYGGNVYYMLERNVPSPAVDVANGAQLTITYSIEMVFPD
jgi:hypothetical protein